MYENVTIILYIIVTLNLTGGCKIEGEEDSWDFGSGAGFYVDASESKWAANYRMYSYVCSEVCIHARDEFS